MAAPHRSMAFSNHSIAFEKRGEIATHLRAVFASDPDADKKLAECITSYIDEEVTHYGDKTMELARKTLRDMRERYPCRPSAPTHNDIMKHVDGRFQIYMGRIISNVDELVTDCINEKIEVLKQELITDLVTPLRDEVASLKKEVQTVTINNEPNSQLAEMQEQLNHLEKEFHVFYLDFMQNFAPKLQLQLTEITRICKSLNTSSTC